MRGVAPRSASQLEAFAVSGQAFAVSPPDASLTFRCTCPTPPSAVSHAAPEVASVSG